MPKLSNQRKNMHKKITKISFLIDFCLNQYYWVALCHVVKWVRSTFSWWMVCGVLCMCVYVCVCALKNHTRFLLIDNSKEMTQPNVFFVLSIFPFVSFVWTRSVLFSCVCFVRLPKLSSKTVLNSSKNSIYIGSIILFKFHSIHSLFSKVVWFCHDLPQLVSDEFGTLDTTN
jgi:hypothetical protein